MANPWRGNCSGLTGLRFLIFKAPVSDTVQPWVQTAEKGVV